MGDTEAYAKVNGASPRADNTLASSPTIADAVSRNSKSGWHDHGKRRLSTTSSSVHSEDLENMTWPAFDGPGAAFEDSGVVLDEEEERDKLPDMSVAEDEMDNERWLEGDGDEEAYSSAALSRRAEMILANAKKRLNVCISADLFPHGENLPNTIPSRN